MNQPDAGGLQLKGCQVCHGALEWSDYYWGLHCLNCGRTFREETTLGARPGKKVRGDWRVNRA